MRNLAQSSLSRRTLLAGLASFGAMQGQAYSTSQVKAFDLGYGLEVRDYRLFPTPDVMRFLLEIHNTTDIAVDTPTVGLLLPHQSDADNFGWAAAFAPVLHPHSSAGLIGVAPRTLRTNRDWGSPEWILCNPLQSRKTDNLSQWEISITHRVMVIAPRTLEISVTATNHGNRTSPPLKLEISGLLRDEDQRICGATPRTVLPEIAPGTSRDTTLHVAEGTLFEYIANPFTLVESVEDMSVEMTLQPGGVYSGLQCPAIMPWNRG